MADFTRELCEAIYETSARLKKCIESKGSDDLNSIAIKLETLAEAALIDGGIPLNVCDMINNAQQLVKKEICHSHTECERYQAPVNHEGLRGRPKFIISYEQLAFFQGLFLALEIMRNIYGSHRFLTDCIFYLFSRQQLY